MSIINTRSLSVERIQNTFSPPEGPKSIPLTLDFSAQPQYELNVGDVYRKGPGYPGLSGLQTLFVDNSQGAGDLKIKVEGSGQTMTVKAGVQGFYPLISPQAGRILFSSSTATITVLLLNVTISAAQWEA